MADNENIVRIQTNFTAGEFDPLLRARIDLEQYRAAAQTLTNVVCMPQGGVERRPGLMYKGTIPSGASPQNGTRLVSFEFSTTQQYVFLFVSNRLYIYKQGTLQKRRHPRSSNGMWSIRLFAPSGTSSSSPSKSGVKTSWHPNLELSRGS